MDDKNSEQTKNNSPEEKQNIVNISEDGKKHEHNQEEYERLLREQKSF